MNEKTEAVRERKASLQEALWPHSARARAKPAGLPIQYLFFFLFVLFLYVSGNV